MNPRWLPGLALLVAAPQAAWLLRRAGEDPARAILHLLLGLSLAYPWGHRSRPAVQAPTALGALASLWILLALCIGAGVLPLPRFLLAMLALGCAFLVTLPGARRRGLSVLAICALLPLSEDSAEFFVGYPARLIATRLATLFLRASGLAVELQGTILRVQGQEWFADAPCSGLRMGWTALALAASLCWLREVSPRRTLALLFVCIPLVLLANALRMAALAQADHFAWYVPPAAHNLIGALAFLPLPLILVSLARPGLPPPIFPAAPKCSPHWIWPACLPFLLAALPRENPSRVSPSPPAWPAAWEGENLRPLPPSALDARFAEAFPGHVARFAAGNRQLLFRTTERPTRRLHASSVCYQAFGYRVSPKPSWRDDQDQLWSSFEASKDGRVVWVREQIRSTTTVRTWPDVAAWHWDAQRGKDPGPWMAITVAQPIP